MWPFRRKIWKLQIGSVVIDGFHTGKFGHVSGFEEVHGDVWVRILLSDGENVLTPLRSVYLK